METHKMQTVTPIQSYMSGVFLSTSLLFYKHVPVLFILRKHSDHDTHLQFKPSSKI
jgi:hypothetical protein